MNYFWISLREATTVIKPYGSSRTNENVRRRHACDELNLSQLRRHAGGKDWDEQCCRPLLFSYRNSIPGSTGGYVAVSSAAYENQALFSCGLHFSCRTGNAGNKTDIMSVHILNSPLPSLERQPKMQRFSGRATTSDGRLRESNHEGSLPRKVPDASALGQKIYCMHAIS